MTFDFVRLVPCLSFALLAACASSGGDGGGTSGNVDGGGQAVCNAGETRCEGNTFQTCSDDAWENTELCSSLCDVALGCVECQPDRPFCSGEDVTACNADGQPGGVVETCTGDAHCSGGACVDLCAEAETNQSYIGCDYVAVDLDNAVDIIGEPDEVFDCSFYAAVQPGIVRIDDARVCAGENGLSGLCDADGSCPAGTTCSTRSVCGLDAEHSPFAVVVSNPQSFPVSVTIADADGSSATVEVGAGQVEALFPQEMGFVDRTVIGSGVSASGYRITSDAPVVAYQFNPLDNVDVFSNDGSLLIPRHAFDSRYYAMSWPSLVNRPSAKDYNGYVAVVAWEDGTELAVTPSADVRAGAAQAAIAAGTTESFTLGALEVLNLEAVGDGDLTGTLVEASGAEAKSFGVLAGHEAVAILSEGASCCADHIEEMMFPTSTWGTEYAIARSQPRAGESDLLRILAQTDGTEVTISGPASGSCPTLAAGAFCEVDITGDVEITATEPVLVGHYLKSTITQFGEGSGDPSLAIAVPVEQFRRSYTFLVPAEYDQQFISVVAQAGSIVTLDGQDVSAQLAAFGDGRAAGRLPVTAGQHTLSCDGGCGLEVYGYSDAVSYLFAGGLDLERIVVE